jgi:high-affinity nickel-transport protein
MFGLDDLIAGWSSGASLAVVVLVAALLGARHATDPDHLAAVGALVAAGRRKAAARLGLVWGLGHALTLVAVGAPVVLCGAVLPDAVLHGAETLIAVVIIVLAARLLLRRGAPARTPLAAFGVGVVHGVGGSAGVGLLLVAAIPSTSLALAALATLAGCTALSMAAITHGLGGALARHAPATPLLGAASLLFGCWYGAAAWSLAPYPF